MVPTGGGGVFPYVSHIGMCRPKRVGFLRCFGLKMGIHFVRFDLESGMVYEEPWSYKKESVASHADILRSSSRIPVTHEDFHLRGRNA